MHNPKILKIITVALFVISVESGVEADATQAEVHEFHVRGVVSYRCYVGYDGKRVFDEKTKEPCDNKDYKKVIVDKVVSLRIEDEPDPENSKELAGGWDEKIEFRKRKFTIAIGLFKNSGSRPYRIRVVAVDDEPVSRQTAVFSEIKSISEMNPVELEYSSVGKKEEIMFSARVEPESKKITDQNL